MIGNVNTRFMQADKARGLGGDMETAKHLHRHTDTHTLIHATQLDCMVTRNALAPHARGRVRSSDGAPASARIESG